MAPYLWVSLQIAAVLAAALVVMVRSDRRITIAFLCALPFTAAGALGLDYALRVAAYAAQRFAGPAPVFGGAMAYGALLGLAGAFALFVRRDRARALDRVAPAFGVLVFVARFGCLLEGCEHGRVTSLPWGWHYAAAHPRFATLVAEGLAQQGASTSLGLHPTPLYEGLVGALAALLAYVVGKRGRPGAAFATVAFVYAIGRCAVEALRADGERGSAGPFTTGQAMSLCVALMVAAYALREEQIAPSVTAS